MTLDLALLLFAFLPSSAFCLLYGFRAAWWRSVEGQHLLALTVALTLLIGRSVVLRWGIEDAPPASWFLRVLVFAIGVLLWQRLWLLVKYQWLNREDR